MLSEIKGKISSSGSNLSERMEDKLTGDFFGALRYIPFYKAMKPILMASHIEVIEDVKCEQNILALDNEFWNENIQLWPYDPLGELDVLLSFHNILIGIEVKYLSGLSADDEIINLNGLEQNRSINQLAVETEILYNLKYGKQPALLLFIAPEPFCYSTVQAVAQRNILKKGVSLGYLSWETIYEKVKELIQEGTFSNFEKLILEDVQKLLKRKGFERFRGFETQIKPIEKNGCFYFEGSYLFKFNFDLIKYVFKGGHYEFS